MKVLTQTTKASNHVSKNTNGTSHVPQEPSDLTSKNQKTKTLLIRARSGDKKAQEELVNYFKTYIDGRAGFTCKQSSKWLSKGELESEGNYRIARMIANYDPLIHYSPYAYLVMSIKNGMRDYVKGEAPVHMPISSVPPSRNGDHLKPETLKDPYSEDLNKVTYLPDTEDLQELLNSPEAKHILNNTEKRMLLELSFGIDLGSNRNHDEKSLEEIAKLLEITIGSVYMRKSRLIKELRALAKEKYPALFN